MHSSFPWQVKSCPCRFRQDDAFGFAGWEVWRLNGEVKIATLSHKTREGWAPGLKNGLARDPFRQTKLLILWGRLGGGGEVHAGGVEDESLDFGFGAVGGDFLTIPEESDSGGVADLGDDFAIGADRGVSGRDEGFLTDGLAVGEDGDP